MNARCCNNRIDKPHAGVLLESKTDVFIEENKECLKGVDTTMVREWNILIEEMKHQLIQEIDNFEINLGLKSIQQDYALGPNGMNSLFLWKVGHLLKLMFKM